MASRVAMLLSTVVVCSACGSSSADVDAAVASTRDAGQDAGYDAAYWTTPWYPTPPVLVQTTDGACPPPEPVDGGPRVERDASTPQLLWRVEPARDPAIHSGLLEARITGRTMKLSPYTEMPNGHVGILFNAGDVLFLTASGGFAAARNRGELDVLTRTAPVTPVGGSWFVQRNHVIAVTADATMRGSGAIVGPTETLYSDSLGPNGEENRSLPTVQTGGRFVFAAGLDGLIGACGTTGAVDWIARYDMSELRTPPNWSLWSAEDDSLYFTPGGPGLYHLSSSGRLLEMIPTAGSTHSAFGTREAIALVPGCGLYVWATQDCGYGSCTPGAWLERWSADLTLLSRWDLPNENWIRWSSTPSPRSVPTYPTPDCGFIVRVIDYTPRVPSVSIVKIDAVGAEQWRVPADHNVNVHAYAFPDRDGGLLFFGSNPRLNAAGLAINPTSLLRVGADGRELWLWELPESDDSAIAERTPLLARNGVLYFGLNGAVAAIDTGVIPGPYGYNPIMPTPGGGPHRDQSARPRW